MNKRSDATLKKIIGNNIKKFRKKMYPGHGGQGKFADAIKIAQPTIANYEAGKQQPSDSRLKKIAKHFETNVAALRGEKNEIILTPDQEEAIAYAHLMIEKASGEIGEALQLIKDVRENPKRAAEVISFLNSNICKECRKPLREGDH